LCGFIIVRWFNNFNLLWCNIIFFKLTTIDWIPYISLVINRQIIYIIIWILFNRSIFYIQIGCPIQFKIIFKNAIRVCSKNQFRVIHRWWSYASDNSLIIILFNHIYFIQFKRIWIWIHLSNSTINKCNPNNPIFILKELSYLVIRDAMQIARIVHILIKLSKLLINFE